MPDLETSLGYCTYCPNLCRHTCPVSTAEPRETLIPRAKMWELSRLRRREVEATAETTAPLYGCTGCGACTDFCLHDVEPARALFDGRALAERRDAGHPALADLPARFVAHAERAARDVRAAFTDAPAGGERASGATRRAGASGAEGSDVRRLFAAEAQVAFFPACDDAGGARKAIDVLARLGADYVAVADLSRNCGGYPLLAGGHPDAFRAHAERVAKELHGYARVVVACPACAHTMRTDYPAHHVSLRPEVVHLAEFLPPLAAHLPARPVAERQPAAFYHDPCYLGRWGGVYDPPRRLLERVLTGVREFSRNRAQAECSGGGGLLPITMPETAEAIADHRVEEAAASDARSIVTGCPTCKKRLSRSGVVARDLVDVLDETTRPR